MPIQTAADSISNSAGSPYGFKNRIINGAMTIDQRYAGASVNTSGAWVYPVDRFPVLTGGTGGTAVFAAQRSTVAPTGFTNSLSLTLTTVDSSKASTELSSIRYPVEGIDCRDLLYGTAGAVTTTLSFWVRSSLIGTYCVRYGNSANDRSYVDTYTINVANTWEYKTVTIPGDTTGTWVNDTTACGIQIWWDLGSGSSYNTTAGSWIAGAYTRTSAQADVTGTSGATFYITGVQLEKGSQATAFDYRPFGTELALCQRYYETSYPSTVAQGTNGYVGPAAVSARTTQNGYCFYTVPYIVQKRATPTISLWSYNGTSNQLGSFDSGTNLGAASALQITAYSFLLCNNSGGNIADGSPITINFAANSEI
jgi:hypothetical protein